MPGSRANSAWRIFSAAREPLRCVAAYTEAMPPTPSSIEAPLGFDRRPTRALARLFSVSPDARNAPSALGGVDEVSGAPRGGVDEVGGASRGESEGGRFTKCASARRGPPGGSRPHQSETRPRDAGFGAACGPIEAKRVGGTRGFGAGCGPIEAKRRKVALYHAKSGSKLPFPRAIGPAFVAVNHTFVADGTCHGAASVRHRGSPKRT